MTSAIAALPALLGADGIINSCLARPPDFIIGGKDDPYLERWFLLPRNGNGNAYVHRITRDDDDRALHDHPWDFTSIILQGAYRDITKGGRRVYGVGATLHHLATDLHRLEVVEGPVWTLVLTGKTVRDWGFECPQGWVPWWEFVDARDKGAIGRGCGQP